MSLTFRFAIISDPHIALPHTIWDHPSRFHLVEVSILALETVLASLESLDLDFLLLPGDLSQHGEPDNHQWLAERLSQLPYPTYVVPGNHDIPEQFSTTDSIGLKEFLEYYRSFGYEGSLYPYYVHEVLPHVHLIGLNSNYFDSQGKQLGMGRLDQTQLIWLQDTLSRISTDDVVLVMLHHNVIEHLPGQSHSPMGRRYMLENAGDLLQCLQQANVRLMFTGHLHVQDVAQHQGIYEITTGSLVSYPHPYRILEFHRDDWGNQQMQIKSDRVTAVPGWADLPQISRDWMGDHSFPFIVKLLSHPPLNLPTAQAETLAPMLRYFWADIANGDAIFNFPQLSPQVNEFLGRFSATDLHGNPHPIDNCTTLVL
jgi:3',5'-cyclic AMP phosphodiesterase CpdA